MVRRIRHYVSMRSLEAKNPAWENVWSGVKLNLKEMSYRILPQIIKPCTPADLVEVIYPREYMEKVRNLQTGYMSPVVHRYKAVDINVDTFIKTRTKLLANGGYERATFHDGVFLPGIENPVGPRYGAPTIYLPENLEGPLAEKLIVFYNLQANLVYEVSSKLTEMQDSLSRCKYLSQVLAVVPEIKPFLPRGVTIPPPMMRRPQTISYTEERDVKKILKFFIPLLMLPPFDVDEDNEKGGLRYRVNI